MWRRGQQVTGPELIEFVGGRIARFKKPKHVVFVPALPRTATGTIDRAKVKEAHGSQAVEQRGDAHQEEKR